MNSFLKYNVLSAQHTLLHLFENYKQSRQQYNDCQQALDAGSPITSSWECCGWYRFNA